MIEYRAIMKKFPSTDDQVPAILIDDRCRCGGDPAVLLSGMGGPAPGDPVECGDCGRRGVMWIEDGKEVVEWLEPA